MPPKSIEFPRFGGLDLRQDPQDAGPLGALDTLNMDLDRRDILRTRDGYTKFTSPALSQRCVGLFSWVRSTNVSMTRLFATTFFPDSKIEAIAPGGTSVATSPLNGLPGSLVAFSGANAYVYSPVGDAAGRLARWDETGGVWTYPAVGYSGVFAAVQHPDNRLVVATTNEGTYSRVRFSNAGVPETFSANDYVDLAPDDGSRITALASFADKLFVFKSNQFFVFYGNSTLSTGTPVFDYRTVNSGIGIPLDFMGCCASSPNGLYFLGTDGVYLTTGGTPVKVSRQLDPLFRGAIPATYQGTALNGATTLFNNQVGKPRMTWFQDRLYLAIPTATGTSAVNDRLLVLDPDRGWLVWDVPVSGMAAWNSSFPYTNQLFFAYASGTNDIGYFNTAATTDGGTSIAARHRLGFWNPGQPGAESWVRETLLDGTGVVTVKTAVNDAATLGTGQAVTLGTSPAVAQGRSRNGFMGRNVSYEFSGTAPWSLSRVIPIAWSQRAPGLKAT